MACQIFCTKKTPNLRTQINETSQYISCHVLTMHLAHTISKNKIYAWKKQNHVVVGLSRSESCMGQMTQFCSPSQKPNCWAVGCMAGSDLANCTFVKAQWSWNSMSEFWIVTCLLLHLIVRVQQDNAPCHEVISHQLFWELLALRWCSSWLRAQPWTQYTPMGSAIQVLTMFFLLTVCVTCSKTYTLIHWLASLVYT